MDELVADRAQISDPPVVAWYSARPSADAQRNAAHLFLAFNNQPVDNAGLMDRTPRSAEARLYRQVNAAVFEPSIRAVVNQTGLQSYLNDRYSPALLVARLFGRRSGAELAMSSYVDALAEHHNSSDVFSLEAVEREAARTIRRKVAYGGLVLTAERKKILENALGMLPAQQRTAIEKAYSLDRPTGVRDVLYRWQEEHSQAKDVHRIRKKEFEGIERLQRLAHWTGLHWLGELLTDDEIRYRQESAWVADSVAAATRMERYVQVSEMPLRGIDGFAVGMRRIGDALFLDDESLQAVTGDKLKTAKRNLDHAVAEAQALVSARKRGAT